MTRKAEHASEAWQALGRLMATMRADFHRTSDHLGLTPGEGRALAALDPDLPRPMRALAESLCCDASNVTWLVDRLEARGYVERRPSPSDRRVKAVALTAAGVDARDHVQQAHAAAPPALMRLSIDELRALTRLVEKATDNGDGR